MSTCKTFAALASKSVIAFAHERSWRRLRKSAHSSRNVRLASAGARTNVPGPRRCELGSNPVRDGLEQLEVLSRGRETALRVALLTGGNDIDDGTTAIIVRMLTALTTAAGSCVQVGTLG
jgi:hypothetical protein